MNKIFIVEKVDGNGRRWWEIHQKSYYWWGCAKKELSKALGCVEKFRSKKEMDDGIVHYYVREFSSFENAEEKCREICQKKEFDLKAAEIRVVKETEFLG